MNSIDDNKHRIGNPNRNFGSNRTLFPYPSDNLLLANFLAGGHFAGGALLSMPPPSLSNSYPSPASVFRSPQNLTVGKGTPTRAAAGVLELYSNDIDPKTRAPKRSKEAVLKDWSKKSNLKTERVNYTADILVDSEFGIPGAITITNKHQKEFFLESITIEGFACGPVHFPCNSWVQSTKDHSKPRVFFSNQPYLPHETPSGLRYLREQELKDLRGDGKGVRKLSDRVYD